MQIVQDYMELKRMDSESVGEYLIREEDAHQEFEEALERLYKEAAAEGLVTEPPTQEADAPDMSGVDRRQLRHDALHRTVQDRWQRLLKRLLQTPLQGWSSRQTLSLTARAGTASRRGARNSAQWRPP